MSEKGTTKLYDGITNISDDIIENAQSVPANTQKEKKAWVKWGAIAACLCLVAAAIFTRFPLPEKEDDPVIPAIDETDVQTVKDDPPLAKKTSESYSSLSELLDYLSTNESHDDRYDLSASGGYFLDASGETGSSELIEKSRITFDSSGEYAYFVDNSGIIIYHPDRETMQVVSTLKVGASYIFTCNNNLFVIGCYDLDDEEIITYDEEPKAKIRVYDITVPQSPQPKDEYVQCGTFTACWMADENIYLVTSDGVCACGWSRLDDVSKYYPALSHNGEAVSWGDEDISILGEPAQVQFTAITVIDGNTCEIAEKEAFYGNMEKLYYGADWVAASVSSETNAYRENPSVYTFDNKLDFTGKINLAKIINVSERNPLKDGIQTEGAYLSIDSITKQDDIYRLIGTSTSINDTKYSDCSFMVIAVDAETDEASYELLNAAEEYPHAFFTEILWEDNRAITCIGITKGDFGKEFLQETRFLFIDFDGLDIRLSETDLSADYLGGRVGVYYGRPLGAFNTLIPMGKGIYLRYSNPAEGPGGFDVYDFSDSTKAKCLYHPENSLSGADAFDYVWYVYDENTVGTLKIILGEEVYYRDNKALWCKYSVDLDSENVFSLISETQLEGTFTGADDTGFSLFDIQGKLYYLTIYTNSLTALE